MLNNLNNSKLSSPISILSLLGGALFGLSFPITIINENAAVISYKQHGEGLGKVIELANTNLKTSSSAYQGELIHFTTNHIRDMPTITDTDFGITVNTGFALERNVEMLQFIEHDSQSTATEKDTTINPDEEVQRNRYTYTKEWTSNTINSATFHDRTKKNPKFSLQSETFVPMMGLNLIPNYNPNSKSTTTSPILEFLLSASDISNFIKPNTLFPIQEDMLKMAGVDGTGTSILSGATSNTNKINGAGGKKMLRRSDYELHDGMLYTKGATGSSDASSASIDVPGQVRISYRLAPIESGLSILTGVDEAGKFVPYTLPSGKSIMMVRMGSLTATQMVRRADFENSLRLNSMRIFSFCLFFFGLLFTLKPLEQMFNDILPIPVVGNVLSSALRVGICRSAFIGAAMFLSFLLGLIWLTVDVMVGGPALAFTPVCMFVMKKWIDASERYGKIQYSRVPGMDNVEDPIEFGLDGLDEDEYHD